MSSSGDSDISDSGEGKTLKATTAIGSTAIGASPKRKRSQRTTDTFRLGVKTKHKVDLVDVTARAVSSSRRQCKCVLCGVAKENKVPPPRPNNACLSYFIILHPFQDGSVARSRRKMQRNCYPGRASATERLRGGRGWSAPPKTCRYIYDIIFCIQGADVPSPTNFNR